MIAFPKFLNVVIILYIYYNSLDLLTHFDDLFISTMFESCGTIENFHTRLKLILTPA